MKPLIVAVRPVSMAAALSVSLCFNIGVSAARTIKITCADDFAGGDAKMRLTYDGEATETLSVVAGVGAFTLPASLTVASDNADGPKLVGISGSGAVSLKLPAFETVEACESKRTYPAVNHRGFISIYRGDPCFSELPPAASPVPVQADISFYLDPGQPATSVPEADFNELKLRYPQTSSIFGGGRFQFSVLPPPDCVFVP